MADADQRLYLLNLTGPDRVGLIAAITGRLYDLGANLADTSFAVLGEGYEFSAVMELPASVPVEDVRADLAGLDVLQGSHMSLEPFQLAATKAANAQITHIIDVDGGDRPGLVARLTEAFQDFGANVVEMRSAREPTASGYQYVTRFAVNLDPGNADRCLAAIANTAGQLGFACSWQEVI